MKTRHTVISLAIVASLVGAVWPTSAAHAITGADWKAGRIMDDVVFNNSADMSVGQIQEFLNSKVPTCDTNGTRTSEYGGGTRAQWGTAHGNPPPYVCLKDYYENPTTHENNLQGRPIPAGGMSTANLIYSVAQSYSINPKVILATLQKESKGPLVTDTWPFASQYKIAMGYACPDTAPCDSQYYGFYNQISSAARQFRRYADNPTNYRHKANQINSVRFNPTVSCGSSDVFIKNQATASLYNYTPYQPNQAALSNLNATGDSCSAHGNRNFWVIYNNWFGPTIRDLVRTVGSGAYLVENGVKRAFPNEITFLSYRYKWQDILSISNAEINQIPDGTPITYNTHFRDGYLVTSPGVGIYVVDNGTKRPFPNEATFLTYPYKYSDAIIISNLEINMIPDGAPLVYDVHRRDGHLVKSSAGGIYVVDNGTKRPFPNEITFLSYFYTWADALAISNAEISLIPDGTPMAYNVHFRDGHLVTASGSGIYVVDNGTKRPFPNEATFFSYSYKFSDALVISAAELNMVPTGTPMPPKS